MRSKEECVLVLQALLIPQIVVEERLSAIINDILGRPLLTCIVCKLLNVVLGTELWTSG